MNVINNPVGRHRGDRSTVIACPYAPQMTYGLFGKFSAQPGKRDELAGYLLEAAELLERDANCIHYIVSTSEEPDAVWVWELWADRAAHDASLEPADVRVLIQQARPLIADMSDRVELSVHGGKGTGG